MNWLGLLSGLGGLFGGASKSSADAKSAQATAAAQQANSELNAYTVQQQAKQQQAQDISQRPTDRLQQGALGDLVTGWTPQKTTWGGAGTIPQSTGGWGDFKLNDMTLQNADLMQRDALLRQMQGQGAADITSVGQVPDVTKNYPKESWLDKILGYGSLGLGAASTALGAYQNSAKK
jgi:hypothetical protein